MSYSKYRAKKTVVNGITFSSQGEAALYLELRRQEGLGKLIVEELQPKVKLTLAKIVYIADFLVLANGRKEWLDFKGLETPVFKLKKKLWRYYGPGVLVLIKKIGNKFERVEEIHPVSKVIGGVGDECEVQERDTWE